mmetsp:Transcript_677/g.2338  ORF Transcript_677/g.2338 Transcript_677/m.2338 type:complete len:271 (+) Transcript_677:1783-2595(+)
MVESITGGGLAPATCLAPSEPMGAPAAVSLASARACAWIRQSPERPAEAEASSGVGGGAPAAGEASGEAPDTVAAADAALDVVMIPAAEPALARSATVAAAGGCGLCGEAPSAPAALAIARFSSSASCCSGGNACSTPGAGESARECPVVSEHASATADSADDSRPDSVEITLSVSTEAYRRGPLAPARVVLVLAPGAGQRGAPATTSSAARSSPAACESGIQVCGSGRCGSTWPPAPSSGLGSGVNSGSEGSGGSSRQPARSCGEAMTG